MSGVELLALLPLLVLSGAIVLILIVIAIYRSHVVTVVLTAIGLILALGALPVIYFVIPRQITPLLTMDGYALFFIGLLVLAGLAVTLFSYHYLEQHNCPKEEYYMLVIIGGFRFSRDSGEQSFCLFFS